MSFLKQIKEFFMNSFKKINEYNKQAQERNLIKKKEQIEKLKLDSEIKKYQAQISKYDKQINKNKSTTQEQSNQSNGLYPDLNKVDFFGGKL